MNVRESYKKFKIGKTFVKQYKLIASTLIIIKTNILCWLPLSIIDKKEKV